MSQPDSHTRQRKDSAFLRFSQDPDFLEFIIQEQASLAKVAHTKAINLVKKEGRTPDDNATIAALLREYTIRHELSDGFLEAVERIKKNLPPTKLA